MSERRILEHIEETTDRLHREMHILAEKIFHMSTQMDALKIQVATTIQLETQAIAMLQSGGGGLPASDLAQVVVLTNQLKTSSDALALVLGGNPGGGTSTEATDVQNLMNAAQQASTVSSDPNQVSGFITQMQASIASLSGAFTRNNPPLPSNVTQQEVATLQTIQTAISNLQSNISNPSQVMNLTLQIQNACSTLAGLIANNPRGVARR